MAEPNTKDRRTLLDCRQVIADIDNYVAEMTSSAFSAVDDVKDARRNANAAHEVAEKYLSRDYSSVSRYVRKKSVGYGINDDNDDNNTLKNNTEKEHAEDISPKSMEKVPPNLQLQASKVSSVADKHITKDDKYVSVERKLECLYAEDEFKNKLDGVAMVEGIPTICESPNILTKNSFCLLGEEENDHISIQGGKKIEKKNMIEKEIDEDESKVLDTRSRLPAQEITRKVNNQVGQTYKHCRKSSEIEDPGIKRISKYSSPSCKRNEASYVESNCNEYDGLSKEENKVSNTNEQMLPSFGNNCTLKEENCKNGSEERHGFSIESEFGSNTLKESHAEDVLSLSLEVEDLKQKLQVEVNSNKKTHLLLKEEMLKTSQLELQLKDDSEKWKKSELEYRQGVKQLEDELSQVRTRVIAAEEDAQKALDIARVSEEAKKKTENMFQNVVNELNELQVTVTKGESRGELNFRGAHQLPVISEHNVDIEEFRIQNVKSQLHSTQAITKDSRKPLCLAGRDLLRTTTSGYQSDDSSSVCSTQDESVGSHWLDLTRRSAEKRRRLRERINNRKITGREITFDSKASKDSKSKDLLSQNENIIRILIESGTRLNLGGKCFRAKSVPLKENAMNLVKNYCEAIETQISRQEEQIKDLRSFSEFLEQKLLIQ